MNDPVPSAMLSGVILSGGQSSRMGQEKGLVKLGGRPLITYVSTTLFEVVDEVVVSVARGMTEKYERVLGKGFRIVEDRRMGMGPLEGLLNSFGEALGEYVLVSPCDTPFLTPKMCELVARSAKGRDGAIPQTGTDYFEPLHGAYRRKKCLKVLDEMLEAGLRRPADAYPRLNLEFIPESVLRSVDPDLLSFWNLNSFDDLELAEMKLSALHN